MLDSTHFSVPSVPQGYFLRGMFSVVNSFL
jgi:c-di-GMP-related signal transduction protein